MVATNRMFALVTCLADGLRIGRIVPAGKPPGTRTTFSQGFIRDFALVWAEEGLEAVRKVAKKSPEAFVAIASG